MPDREEAKARPSKFPAKFPESLVPTTVMGWAMLAGVAFWFFNWVFSEEQTLFGSRWLKTLCDIGSGLALVPLGYFLYRGARWTLRHLLWRLRRRLIVTYFLIGVLPLALLISLVALGGYALLAQSSSELVARQLQGYLEQSHAAAEAIGRDLGAANAAALDPAQLRRQLQDRADALAPILPGVALAVRRGDRPAAAVTGRSAQAGGHTAVPPDPPSPFDQAPLPAWLKGRPEFHGLTVEETESGARRVLARHIISLTAPERLVFQFSYPIGAGLSSHLSRTTGLAVRPGAALFPPSSSVRRAGEGDERPEGVSIEISAGGSRSAGIRRVEPGRGIEEDLKGVPIFMPMTDWATGKERENAALYVEFSELRPAQIFTRLRQYRTRTTLGRFVFGFIAGLAGVFLLITLVAVVSAAFLTRSITGAVHHLYEGTKRIEAGDLLHQIPTRGRDQLGALAVSFNQMTRSVRELLRVSAEKERLDQEMKIAAEVQARLFPRRLPPTVALDIAPGICIPARAVSGDYYDFLEVAPGLIGIVVADVCGKGVSAALLMANLQANLRGQVQSSHEDGYENARGAPEPGAGHRHRSAAMPAEPGESAMTLARHGEAAPRQSPVDRIVQRINRQLQSSIIDASYVTLFYAEYDEPSSTLRYTNAGHNPPLVYRRGRRGEDAVERLDCGGTVLGLFRDAEYEDRDVRLESGDVLAAFTDGLVEARNPEGLEFGEERVVALLKRHAALPALEIERQILSAVRNWTASAEQEDDLTLVVLKKR